MAKPKPKPQDDSFVLPVVPMETPAGHVPDVRHGLPLSHSDLIQRQNAGAPPPVEIKPTPDRALDILRRLLPRLRKRAIAGWMANRCIACDYPHYPGRVCDCPHHEAEELLNDDPV
jgi:hypothetical protein